MKIELNEHPKYTELSGKYKKYRDLHEGDHDVLKKAQYLWLHELEDSSGPAGNQGSRLRAIREQRSRYLNLTEPIVSRWLSFLFRRGLVVPESIKKAIGKEEYNNISGDGLSFDSFIRERVGRNYVQFGRPVILVDTSQVHAATVAEAKQAGLRPYMDILDPLEIVDWQYASDAKSVGKLQFLRTQYETLEPRASSREKPKMGSYSREFVMVDGKYHQRLYKMDSSKKEFDLINEQPFGDFDHITISELWGDSFIKDSSEMQLLLFNLMSAESSGLNSQAFQRLFAIGAFGKDAKMMMNEYLINFLPEGSSIQTVEPFNNAPISGAVDKAIMYTFKVAFNELHSLANDSKESPSAETRREMRDDLIALVQTSLTEIEDLVNNATRDYLQVKGARVDERITLDKNITEDDIEREIMIYQAHLEDFRKIAGVRKGIIKKHVKYFGLPEEEAIMKEIDTASLETQGAEQNRQEILRGFTGG